MIEVVRREYSYKELEDNIAKLEAAEKKNEIVRCS
jgi:hypothetical protein